MPPPFALNWVDSPCPDDEHKPNRAIDLERLPRSDASASGRRVSRRGLPLERS